MSISHLLTFLKKVLTLCLIYSLSRLAFYFYNFSDSEVSHLFLAFLEGIRFDISAILYIIPLCCYSLFTTYYPNPRFIIVFKYCFILVNTPLYYSTTSILSFTLLTSNEVIDFFSFITKDDFFAFTSSIF